ncbi:MAG: STAS domain-containing protein [Sedimentisphaerales bacterium]|nr:STAS domain-containing protein [Sedimentisphaerales bacterium]
MTLSVKVIRAKPGAVTLAPLGPLDSETYRILDAEIKGALAESVNTLVLDMAGVEFITSSAIGIITRTQAALARKGGELAMINLQPQVKKAFEIMNLIPNLNIFEDEKELDEYLAKVQQRILDGEEGI